MAFLDGIENKDEILKKLDKKLKNRILRMDWLNEYIKSGRAKMNYMF